MKKTTKLFLLAAALCCLQQSYAQTNPKRAEASKSKVMHGVIQPLNEGQTYTTIFPDKLQYWESGKKVGGFWASLPTYPSGMKAKEAKKDQAPDITFTLLTTGIQNVERSEPKAFSRGGKVVEFTYTFPCVLQVTDRDGKVLKRFELSSDENVLATTVHPSFLNDVEQTARTVAIPATMGFMSSDVAKEVDDKLDSYLARVEFNEYYELVKRATQIISVGYGYPKMMYAPAVMDLNKKEKAQFVELNGQIEQLISQISEAFSAPISSELQEKLVKSGEYFESSYTPTDASKDIIQLYAFNSAMAYLFGGLPDEAYKQYCIASPTFGLISASAGIFEELYPVVSLMSYLYATKNEDEVIVNPVYSVSERKDMEQQAILLAKQQEQEAEYQARQAELAAHNVNNERGYVVTKEGDKIEGDISMKFVELKQTQIVDLDLGKLVWVRPATGKPQSFRPGGVSYIMVGSRRFEPVTVSESSVVKVLGALAGSIGSTYFMEVVHKNGGCAAFCDPAITSSAAYYVKSKEDGKAESYGVVLNAKKSAEKFFAGQCADLLARLKAKEFESTRDGLVKFVDELASCIN